MQQSQRTYLPAAGRDWALPLYDPFVKLLGGEKTRRTLLEQADLGSQDRVLDVGCGTGTLAVMIKRLDPGVDVVGLDPDPNALARARRKAERAGLSVQLDQGFSDELPYPDASFDGVFSSFMFHHLPRDERESTLREVRRVLAPGGSLHLVDFTHSEGVVELMGRAGFQDSRKLAEGSMLFGLLRFAFYRAASWSASVDSSPRLNAQLLPRAC